MMSHSANSERVSGLNAPDSTSTSLLERVKARSPEAWQRFVELYGPLVYNWCRLTGLQTEDAADVSQEVFASVARNVANLRPDRPGDSFRGWVWTITRNNIRDHFRRRHGEAQARGGTDAQRQLARIPDEPPVSSEPGSEEKPRGTERSGLERRALELIRSEFEDRTWQVFWRTTVDRRSPADVAEEFGMTVQAVYKAKFRVMRRIRQDLGGLLD